MEIKLLLTSFKRVIDQRRPNEGKEFSQNLSKYFEQPDLSESEIDCALEAVFQSPVSTIQFLKKTITLNKLFKDSNVEILHLYRILLTKYQKRLLQYAKIITDCLSQFINSSQVSAKEKELAVLVIYDIILLETGDDTTNRREDAEITELFEQLFFVFNQKNAPNRFLQNVFELVGVLSKKYPHLMVVDYAKRFNDTILFLLETQLLKNEKLSFTTIAGAVQGLNDHFMNFAPNPSVDDTFCRRVYACIKKLSDPGDISDKLAFRNAMKLLTTHSFLFSQYLYQDYVHWQFILKEWLKWDVTIGMPAIDAFHKEVAACIEAQNEPEDIDILRKFIDHFQKILQAGKSTAGEIRIAIRGFGVMAKVCKRHFTTKELFNLLTLIIQRSEHLCMRGGVVSKRTTELEYLPDFIQALSEIMSHIQDLSKVQITSLQNIVIILMNNFPFLAQRHHKVVIGALLTTFYNIFQLGGETLGSFLEKVTRQTVIWMCSCKLDIDVWVEGDSSSDWKENITYKAYLPLWNGLLVSNTDDHLFTGAQMMSRKLFEHTMSAFFFILDKINLETIKRKFGSDGVEDEFYYFCDPNIDLEPVKPKDFHLFFNLIDLFKDLLKSRTLDWYRLYFADWFAPTLDYLVRKSYQHPLISGFVKMLEVVLKVGIKLKMFENEMHDSAVLSLNNRLTEFIKRCIGKTANSSGELQTSLIRLIFVAPMEILEPVVQELIPIFLIAFDIGQSTVWMSHISLTCLERLVWQSSLAESMRDDILQQVLPHLDRFLANKTKSDQLRMEITKPKLTSRRRLVKKTFTTSYQDNEWLVFQKRLMDFIGKLEPQKCLYIIKPNDKTNDNLVKWDAETELSLTIQCDHIQPIIHLENFIPRVCELATSSTDRNAKISACEFLHATTLYLIGSDKCSGAIWIEVCQKILLLGCDTDVTVQQLFEPLLLQICHYMSHPARLMNPGSEIFLNQLIEAITQNNNSNVRDLSGRCLREFLTWTVRQLSTDQPTISNLTNMFPRLKLLDFDSSGLQRAGSALIFNNTYRIIREDEDLIDTYTLELFDKFCLNFIMSEDFDDDSMNNFSLEQTGLCLDHLIRIFLVRHELFNKPSKNRKIPVNFDKRGENRGTLKYVLEFLFSECGSKQEKYRQKCMEMFSKLALSFNGITGVIESPNDYIEQNFSVDKILKVFEGGTNGIAKKPQIVCTDSKPLLSIHTWLEHFLVSLDCHTWLLGGGSGKLSEKIFQDNSLINAISYYLNEVNYKSPYELISSVDSKYFDDSKESAVNMLTDVYEIEETNRLKGKILLQIIDLLTNLLRSNWIFSNAVGFWRKNTETIGRVLIDLLYQSQDVHVICQTTPQRLEYETKLGEFFSSIVNNQHLILTAFKDSVLERLIADFKQRLQSAVTTIGEGLFSEVITAERNTEIVGMDIFSRLFVQKLENHISPDTRTDLDALAKRLLNHLFSGLFDQKSQGLFQINLPPLVQAYANKLLAVAVNLHNMIEELVSCILKPEQLRIHFEETSVITQGQYFISVYKRTIFHHFSKTHRKCVNVLIEKSSVANIFHLLRILIDFLDHFYKSNKKNTNLLDDLVNHLLMYWPTLYSNIREAENSELDSVFAQQQQDFQLVDLIHQVTLMYPQSMYAIGQRAIGLKKWLTDLIASPVSTNEILIRVISLIPCITGADLTEDIELLEALRKFQSLRIPLVSSEYPEESLERTNLMAITRSLIHALVASQSPTVLKFLIHATCADPHHIIEREIRECLEDFVKLLSGDQQLHCLSLSFDFFLNLSLHPELRKTILKRFVLTLLKNCQEQQAKLFYQKYIKRICELCDSNYVGFNAQEMDALTSRCGGFELIETYAGLFPKESLNAVDCIVARALLGKSEHEIVAGNKVISEFSKRSYKIRSEIFMSSDLKAQNLFRQFNCMAYSALCALICSTQARHDFYNILFKENPMKNEYIWKKIIDLNDPEFYDPAYFQLDDYRKIRHKIVSIRKPVGSAPNSTPVEQLPRYIQTQNIYDSSLTDDVLKLDMNHLVVRTDAEVLANNANPTLNNVQITLKKSKINEHEVMPIVCGVIRHMFENKLTQIPTNFANINTPAPIWVNEICTSIEDQQQHKYVRLFLATVIYNSRELMRVYASRITAAILKLIADGCVGDLCTQYVIDLVVMLLSWHEIYVPGKIEDKSYASTVLLFLMERAYHEKKDVFKLNLDLVKVYIELWKDILVMPMQFLYDSLNKSSRLDSRDNICGIQLNSIVLANGLLPWSNQSREAFLQAVLICLNNEYVMVYQPAAELMGMCLQRIDPSEVEEIFTRIVEKLFQVRKKDEKKFMLSLYGLHKHYPNIADPFFNVIIDAIPNAVGSLKRIYMEMFLTRMEILGEEIFREMAAFGIMNLLKQYEYQILALHIVNKALPHLRQHEISALLKEISNFVDINRNEARDLMFEILMYIKQKGDQNAVDLKVVNQILLRGLAADTDNDIVNRIFKFWSANPDILSPAIEKRFTDLLTHMYDTKNEQQFIAICSQYLLEIPINNPNSKRQVCKHQNDLSIKLKEYQLDTSYRRYSSRATPLFVESQQKNLLMGDGSQQMHYVLKQTQADASDRIFEPTQDPETVTQTANMFTLNTQNSLLFTTSTLMLDRRSQKSTSLPATADKSQTTKVLEKLENVTEKKIYYRPPTTKVKNQEKITLFRRYRYGDYPDLLINDLALLMPLQGLVKRDNQLARLVFVELFKSVLAELTEDRLQQVLHELNNCIQSIISQTVNCDYTLYTTIMELAITYAKQVDLKPEQVAFTANINDMMIMGVLYLEKRLNLDISDEDGSVAKSNTSSVTIEEFCWYKLSELYSTLSESEIASGILTDKLKFSPNICKAEGLELDGDYLGAYKVYRSIVESATFSSTIEQNFCYESYYDCLVEMGMWGELFETVQKAVDSYEEFWTDDFNQEHLLPHLIRSEVRLMLHGHSNHNDEFQRRLHEWLLDPEKSEYIKLNFGYELTMLYIAHGDTTTSRVFSENVLRYFFAEWEKLNVLSDKVRTSKLLNIRKVAEIHNCSKYLLNEQNTSIEADLTVLCQAWSKSELDISDSTTLWDSIVVTRQYMAQTLANKFKSPETTNLCKSVMQTSFKLLEVAIAQKNVMYSDKLLSRLASICDSSGTTNNQLLKERLELLRGRLQVVKASRTTASRSQKLLVHAWTKLQTVVDEIKGNPLALNLEVESYEHISAIGQRLFLLCQEVVLEEEVNNDIVRLTSSNNHSSLFEKLYQHSLWCLNQAMNACQSVEDDDVDAKLVGRIFFKISQFRYELYNNDKALKTTETDHQIIFSTLRAMRYGEPAARQFFPCILQLDSLGEPELQSVFETEAAHVSEWMFLNWLPQLFSHFNFNSPCFLDTLLCRLAKVYPNALIYRFRLSLLQHQQSQTSEERLIKREAVMDIMKNFNNHLVYKLIDGLSNVCLSSVMLHFQLSKILIQLQKTKKIDVFKKSLKDVITDVYERNMQGTEADQIRKYKEKLTKLLSETNARNILFDTQTIINECAQSKTQNNVVSMKKICPWLASYQWHGKDQFLEIPGQYNHLNQRPNAENHVKIVKFGHSLQVYRSQRMPMKVVIYGSDGKTYNFLVKYGEDLRQDQRIQQLLHIMNRELLLHKECRAQNLHITTYKIEPLSGYVGLMSFVDNTVSVDGFLGMHSRKQGVDFKTLQEKATVGFKRFLARNQPIENNNWHLYGKAVQHLTLDQIKANYREVENVVDPFLLRSAFYNIARTPECFFTLRNNFAKSLAVMNIAHWLLGIGDRHLLNMLINTKNCQVIGIDFNLCFGAATFHLPVPELIPFRLTPQFVNVMDPMGVSGIIKKSMVHAMRCFRTSKNLLKACMEVFVKEPAVDWLDMARDCYQRQAENSNDVPADWNSASRIRLADDKLNGINPKKVLMAELSMGVVAKSPGYLNGYLRVVEGNKQFNRRSQVPDNNLTVEDQVACLIDLATDPAVLGVTYSGWCPWI